MVTEKEDQSVKEKEDNTAQEEPGESVSDEEAQGCAATLYQFTEDPESSQAVCQPLCCGASSVCLCVRLMFGRC